MAPDLEKELPRGAASTAISVGKLAAAISGALVLLIVCNWLLDDNGRQEAVKSLLLRTKTALVLGAFFGIITGIYRLATRSDAGKVMVSTAAALASGAALPGACLLLLYPFFHEAPALADLDFGYGTMIGGIGFFYLSWTGIKASLVG
jgi:hypothetical protein